MRLVVMPGDGIGPEITAATLAVLEAADRRFGLDLEVERHAIGLEALAREGTTLPARVVDAVKAAHGSLLGPISHHDYPAPDEGGVNVSSYVRVRLDLYANIRPNRTRAGLGRIAGDLDMVLVRECTEGFYADRNMFKGVGELMPSDDMALALRKVTGRASRRIAKVAFDTAMGRPRRKVTAVHKANVMKISDGLFLEQVRAVAREYPDVAYEETIVDATAALLVRTPQRFDVVVTTNMFGDILSDLAAELAGSLGLAAGILAGDELVMGQAQHGSAPDIQGRNVANPTSLILSAAMVLDWMGKRHGARAYRTAAAAIDQAVDVVLATPSLRTADIGGSHSTSAFGSAVAETVRRVDAPPPS